MTNEDLCLVEPQLCHEAEYAAMMTEWINHGGRLNPAVLRSDGKSYAEWLEYLKKSGTESGCGQGMVPQSLYFLMRRGENRILGALSIRHRLNESLLATGGHIGYGVRPAERKKGYATRMLAIALDKCKEMGLDRVLVTCATDNEGSRKVILCNGGVFESQATNENGTVTDRYWIDLKQAECPR